MLGIGELILKDKERNQPSKRLYTTQPYSEAVSKNG